MSEIPDNDPVFGSDAASIVGDWCARSGIALGAPAALSGLLIAVIVRMWAAPGAQTAAFRLLDHEEIVV